jgi:hypothetical protein
MPSFGPGAKITDTNEKSDQGQLPDSLVMTTRGAIGASAPLWLAMQIPSVNFKFSPCICEVSINIGHEQALDYRP